MNQIENYKQDNEIDLKNYNTNDPDTLLHVNKYKAKLDEKIINVLQTQRDLNVEKDKLIQESLDKLSKINTTIMDLKKGVNYYKTKNKLGLCDKRKFIENSTTDFKAELLELTEKVEQLTEYQDSSLENLSLKTELDSLKLKISFFEDIRIKLEQLIISSDRTLE